MNLTSTFFSFVLVLLICAHSVVVEAATEEKPFVILSVSKDKKLAVYSINETDGKLKLEHETEVQGNPGCSTVNADGDVLYVAMKKTNSIAVFEIGDNAKLKLLGEANVGSAASYLTIDPTGQFLLSSYYAAGQVAVHRIEADGSLAAAPLQTVETDERAHCITLDPSGNFAFVPHTRPNAIFQFAFDSTSGNLTPNETTKLIREEHSGPRHLWFHPTNGHAYGSDEQGSSITNYRFDSQSGQLEVVETLSSLPPGGFEGKNTTSDIEVHPSGKFVFIANRGHDTIASFAIDEDTRKLTLLQHAATEPTTRSFNISPDGKYLVAAGQKSNRLRIFRIGDDGNMKLLSTQDCGKAPWWVQIVDRE